MRDDEFLSQVSRVDLNVDYFVDAAVNDVKAREKLIHEMLTHPHIMVYYHCFEILQQACEKAPREFYPYWREFAGLLSHQNSYHRDFGLVLISQLAGVDAYHYLDGLLPVYLSHASDKKFGTAAHCVKSCVRIINARPDLGKLILENLLDQDAATPFTESQAALLKADLLVLIEQLYPCCLPDNKVAGWITAASTCISPKSRRAAKALMQKYQLPR